MDNKVLDNVSMLYIQVDIEGYITAVAQEAYDGHMETDITMEEFIEKYGAENVTDGKHKYINGEIVSDGGTERSRSVYLKLQKEELRDRRKLECYPIVNRGQVWYDTLTSEQRRELSSWYTAWLDVTETLEVPEKPFWLKD
jgi:hypothetical protein